MASITKLTDCNCPCRAIEVMLKKARERSLHLVMPCMCRQGKRLPRALELRGTIETSIFVLSLLGDCPMTSSALLAQRGLEK